MGKVVLMDKNWISKKVYEKYPKTEKEFCCWQEKQRLESLRHIYRIRLEQEREAGLLSPTYSETKEV